LSTCGSPLDKEDTIAANEKEKEERSGLISVFTLYFILLLVCVILKFTKLTATFEVLGTVELVFIATISVFSVLNFNELKKQLSFRKLVWWYFPVIVVVAAGSNFLVGYLVDFINSFSDDIFYVYMYKETAHPLIWSILGIAVQPAIFEELAFRGIMFNHLDRLMEKVSIVMVTGFLFALLHLSIISITWLMLLGMLLGWMRKRTGTLWYGIVFHFVFNLTFVISEGYQRGWLFQ
jgi:membrane protease YdiL (CAAX protease family)